MIQAFFTNLQILSALIWACTIIIASMISNDPQIGILLTTAAGMHVLLLQYKTKASNTISSCK